MVLPALRPAPSTTTVPAMLRRITTTTNFEPNTLQVEVANTLQVEAATWPKRGVLLTTGVVGVVKVQSRRNYAKIVEVGISD